MRVLVADASSPVRAALLFILEQQPGVQIAGEACDAINLMAQTARDCPDVILLDSELPGLQVRARVAKSSLAELVETLRLFCPTARIVALHSNPLAVKDCLEAGADAFACKSDPPDGLLALLEGYARVL